jgi:hypothetical protein
MSAFTEKLLNSYKDEMISFMKAHPEYFEEAIQLAIANKQSYSWRAAWLLWSCMEENDKRIKKYIKKIVDTLSCKNDSHQRELLKILLKMELGEEQESILLDHCMNIWESINKPPAVRVNALKFIVKIAQKHPELAKEITFLTEDQYVDSLSRGAKNSVSKLMRKLAP